MNRQSILSAVALLSFAAVAHGQPTGNIFQATLGESGQKTAEVSTEELRGILADKSAVVLDTRPFREFAISHVPGALNVAAKPGVPISLYVSDVAEIGRLLEGKKETPLVLYCNGPFCGKSKRLADELLAAGYTSVRRYQLGIPVWRALGGLTEIEPEGLRHVIPDDRTAVVIDTREADVFRSGSLANARNIPRSAVLEGKDVGEVKRAKDDGRLPMEDHNTRIIVIGRDAAEAQYVATALAREAFHNVAYFRGSFEQARAAVETAALRTDEKQLLERHQAILAAHLENDVDALLAGQADDFVLVNRGEISSPTKEQRRAFLGPYLATTKFEYYRDTVPPIVSVSRDGSLAWVAARVEARGTRAAPDAAQSALEFKVAWIELYERRGLEWLEVGNVSSFAPSP